MAQTNKLTYTSVAVQSEEYFNLFQYKELIKLGDDALKAHIDFYDLRVRLGLAHYRKSNYEAASIHFERAIEMNPSDLEILKYAYRCFLYTGQYQRANMLLIHYPQINPDYKPKMKGIHLVEVEAGSLQTSQTDAYDGQKLAPNGNVGEANLFSSMDYLRLYNEVLLSPDTKLHFGTNVFQTNQLSILQFFQKNVNQTYSSLNMQANVGFSKLWSRGWATGLGMGFYRQNYTHPYVASDINPPTPNSLVKDTSEITHAISMSLYASKRMKFIEPVVFLNYGNFDFLPRYQLEMGLTYYPLAKDKLFSYSSISLNHTDGTSSIAYQQKVGYTFLPFMSAELSYMGGSLDNYMGHMGFLTLNTFDPITYSLGVDLHLFKGKYALTPGYRYQERSSSYFLEEGFGNIVTKNINYINHLFFITFKCQL
jgi:tetratricopeptide (TPR) repeat protein